MKKIAISLLAAGAALRVVGLTVSPIWYDEAFTVFLARLPDRMIRLEYGDFNPPLWQLIASLFLRVFGENEFALRLPALLCSLAALWLAWEVAREMLPVQWDSVEIGSSTIYIAVAALLALLPYHFWMAQDSRCYAMMAALYMAVLYFAIKGRWLGFGASIGLLVYSHSTGIFYGAAAGLGALVLRWPDRKRIIISGAVGAATILPWLPAFFDRAANHWIGPLTGIGLLQSLYYVFFAADPTTNYQIFTALVIAATLVAALVVSLTRLKDTRSAALTAWAVGPLLLMIAVSPIKNLIFYRPLSAMLLPCCIWIPASLWPTARRQWRYGWVLPITWAVFLLVGVITWTPGLKGGNLREVANIINDQFQPGDVVYHATGTSYLPFALYLSEPGYVLDEEQHDGLLQTHLQIEFGIPRAALEDIPHQRAWVIWSRDWLVTDQANERMEEYIHGGILIGKINYWQASDIEVYLVQ